MGGGFWLKQAQGLSIDAHDPWAILVRDTLKAAKPTLHEELQQKGELDAYSIVTAHEMYVTYNRLRSTGATEIEAREITFDDLLPREPVETEEYELEGGMADQIAALEAWLSIQKKLESDL